MQMRIRGRSPAEPHPGNDLIPRHGVPDGDINAALQQMEEMAELRFIMPDHHPIPSDIGDPFPLDRLIHAEGGAVEIIETVNHRHDLTVGRGMNVYPMGVESGDIGEMEIVI